MDAAAIASANDLPEDGPAPEGRELVIPGARPPARLARIASASRGGRFWPLRGPITSPFGPRGAGFHTGVDIAQPYGTPVLAADGGEVVFAGWDGDYGKSIVVAHPDGTSARYAHLSAILVELGETVEVGQVIGRVGSTGLSTGPHLHFELNEGGRKVDPLPRLGD